MSIYTVLKGYLHKDDRHSKFIQDILKALADWLELFNEKLVEFYSNFYFDKLTLDGVIYFEKELDITPQPTQTIEERRASIQAKWLANNHNSIHLIQAVCDAWKNGEIKADFIGGKIQLKFIDQFGTPDNLDTLKSNIDEVKTAHIPFVMVFRYLLIENIHEVKTIEEMEEITIDMFESGEE